MKTYENMRADAVRCLKERIGDKPPFFNDILSHVTSAVDCAVLWRNGYHGGKSVASPGESLSGDEVRAILQEKPELLAYKMEGHVTESINGCVVIAVKWTMVDDIMRSLTRRALAESEI